MQYGSFTTGHRRFVETALCAGRYGAASGLRNKILGRLGFSSEKLNLEHLPPTGKYANHLSWLEAISPLVPAQPVETIFMQELPRDERFIQTLIISQMNVPEELHTVYSESFFILEGRCACSVGGQVF